MKKSIIILTFVLISISLFADFGFFPENPADLAQRNYSQITIPGVSYELSLNNTFLRFDDLNLFQKGRILSESEKNLLTNEDITVFGNFNTSLVNFGHKNWNFSIKTLASCDIEVLEKMYTKFVFSGNESDVHYTGDNGEGSNALVFLKTSFDYAYPKPLNFGMIPGLFPSETNNIFLSGLRDLPIYVGANINLNYSLQYAGIVESEQYFGTFKDSTYYSIYTRFMNTDAESSGQLSPSFGFGLKVPFYSGNFHFNIDDLFLQLTYRDLEGWIYAKSVTDSLDLMQTYYEAVEHVNIENDTIRTKSKTVKINPSFTIGAEYQFFNKLDVMMRYTNDQFSYNNGFYTAAGIKLGGLPFQFGLGYRENVFYQIKTGLNFKKFEWMIGTTSYYGFFRYARGFGIQSEIRIKY
jgi:hypothetical protein